MYTSLHNLYNFSVTYNLNFPGHNFNILKKVSRTKNLLFLSLRNKNTGDYKFGFGRTLDALFIYRRYFGYKTYLAPSKPSFVYFTELILMTFILLWSTSLGTEGRDLMWRPFRHYISVPKGWEIRKQFCVSCWKSKPKHMIPRKKVLIAYSHLSFSSNGNLFSVVKLIKIATGNWVEWRAMK